MLLYASSLVRGRDCRSPSVKAAANLALKYSKIPEIFCRSDKIVDFVVLITIESNVRILRTLHQAKFIFISLPRNFDSV